MDHRVEPPSWLPEGAAPEGADPDSGDSTVSAEAPSDKLSYGNGQQDATGSFKYSYDSSYTDSQDSRFGGNQDSPFAGKQDDPFGSKQDDPFGSNHGGTFGASQGNGTFGEGKEGSLGASEISPDGGNTPDRPFQSELPAPSESATTYTSRVLTESSPAEHAPGDTALSMPPGQASSPYNYTAGIGVGAASAGAAVGAAAPATTPRPKAAVSAQPRRANLVIARLEPWSVMKFSFLISLVAWLVLFVAVLILYYALSGLGVFDALQRTLSSVTSGQNSGGVDITKWTSVSRVVGYTMLIGAVNVVLITALSTVGSMIYNLVTHLGGGVEVTLKETE